MPKTALRKPNQNDQRSMQYVTRTAVPSSVAIPNRHAVSAFEHGGDPVTGKRMVAQGISQTDPEVAATIVSEAIGRTMTMRREARSEGDVGVVTRLSKRLSQLAELRDRIHAGDEGAIRSALTGAWN